MKAVLFYETAQVEMDKIMSVYPRHQELVAAYAREGKILAIGTFANPMEGAMAIFRDKESAAEFSQNDPFVLEGIVASQAIKEWNETLLP